MRQSWATRFLLLLTAALFLGAAIAQGAEHGEEKGDAELCSKTISVVLESCGKQGEEKPLSFSACINPRMDQLKGCTRENYQGAAIAARAAFEAGGGRVAEEALFNEPRSIFYRIFQDKNADMATRVKWATFLMQSYFGDYVHVFVVGFAFLIFSMRSSVEGGKAELARMAKTVKAVRGAAEQQRERAEQLTINFFKLEEELSRANQSIAALSADVSVLKRAAGVVDDVSTAGSDGLRQRKS